jgi:hypothetical protein
MSFDMQVNLRDLLQVEGLKIKSVINGGADLDLDKVRKELEDEVDPQDLGYAQWLMTSIDVMYFPGYEGWREYYTHVDSDHSKVIIGFNVGSASPFRKFFTDLCLKNHIEMVTF